MLVHQFYMHNISNA